MAGKGRGFNSTDYSPAVMAETCTLERCPASSDPTRRCKSPQGMDCGPHKGRMMKVRNREGVSTDGK